MGFDLAKDTWYDVLWVDAVDDSAGNPEDADIAYRLNRLLYIGEKTRRFQDVVTQFLIFAYTEEEKHNGQDHSCSGWFAIPVCMIKKIKEAPNAKG